MRSSLLIATTVALVSVTSAARADRRAFTETYEYMTIPDGDVELELHNTQSHEGIGDAEDTYTFDAEIEVEYGITSHWDIALYQLLSQTNAPAGLVSQPLHYAGTKLETRYRFGERGQYPVDTVAYFEVVRGFGETFWEIEPKLILARDFGQLNIALNLIPELEIEEEVEAGGQTELEVVFEPGWALGASYELAPSLKLGAETFGKLDSAFVDNELFAWIGPSVGWAPSPKLWIASTAAVGLTGRSDDLVLRFIIGLGI